MTEEEFYNEFNLVYNNLASNQAPGLDKYEISVYLTKAQNLLVDNFYTEFEKSEESRRNLVTLLSTERLKSITIPSDHILYPEYTTTYPVIDNVRYIIHETVKMSDKANKCIRNSFLNVRPCLHDEVDTTVKNPFKFNIRRALRLDTALENKPYIEILTKDKNIEYYQIRYIMNPKPIILDIFTEQIDGIENTTSTGSLPANLHRQIVEIAAKLAYSDYKQ